MSNKLILLAVTAVVVALYSCSNTAVNDKFSKVATKENGIVTLHKDNLGDTVDFPISKLAKSLQMVQLDSDVNAYVLDWWQPTISKNYIVSTDKKQQVKLFNRASGKFICNVGAKGRGEGEYSNLAKFFISEELGEIYVVQYSNKYILSYTLDGMFKEKIPIPEGYNFADINLKIDSKNRRFTASSIVYGKVTSSLVWQQDFNGNVFDSISYAPLLKFADINCSNNTANLAYSFTNINNIPDTLFYYKEQSNTLEPVFCIDLGNAPELEQPSSKSFQRSYAEVTNYFLAGITSLDVTEYEGQLVGWSAPNPQLILVDKKELTGAIVKLVNDFGGLRNLTNVSTRNFSNNNFTYTIDAIELIEKLEKQKEGATETEAAEIDKIISSLDPEGNTVMFLGELK